MDNKEETLETLTIPFEWEYLDEGDSVTMDSYTYRSRVFGGWIVCIGEGGVLSSVFIPDPNHEWKVS